MSRPQRTFLSRVVGPHFETICRNWARWEADPTILGGYPTRAAAGIADDLRATAATDPGTRLVDLDQLYATN